MYYKTKNLGLTNTQLLNELEYQQYRESSLYDLMKIQWSYEGTYISPNLLLENSNDSLILLNEIINRPNKLVLSLNENDCNICIRQELELIKKTINKPNKLIIITTNKSFRPIYVLLKSYNIDIPCYKILEKNNNNIPFVLKNHVSPFAFWLNKTDYKIRGCHIAKSGFREKSKVFYTIANEKLAE